jgi:hypothetical protein
VRGIWRVADVDRTELGSGLSSHLAGTVARRDRQAQTGLVSVGKLTVLRL